MEGKTQTKSTDAQLKQLTEYMSLNPAFANGELNGPLGSRNMEAQWKELKDLLGEIGPDVSIEQWQQTWSDLKSKARHANAEASAAHAVTGNSDLSVPAISDTGISPNKSGIGRKIPIPVIEDAYPNSSMLTQENIVIIEDALHNPLAPASTPLARRNSQLKKLYGLMSERNNIRRRLNLLKNKRRYS